MKQQVKFGLAIVALTLGSMAGNAGAGSGHNHASDAATRAAAGEAATANTEEMKMETMTKTGTIVETAIAAGSFKTLVAAIQAAGLGETLNGDGPFTVFAPTDEAFAKLPKGTLESLLKPENKAQLVSILTYHVVPGRVMASDVVKLTSARTVQGGEADIKVKDGTVMVDGARVVKTDVAASNGVIHVIDGVILPENN